MSRATATLLCVLITPPALFLVVLAAGSGHGTYWLAKTLFPWTMMSTAWTRAIVQPYVALGIAQYPLYGIVLDMARARSRFMPAVLALAAVHVCAIMLAFAMANPSFTP